MKKIRIIQVVIIAICSVLFLGCSSEEDNEKPSTPKAPHTPIKTLNEAEIKEAEQQLLNAIAANDYAAFMKHGNKLSDLDIWFTPDADERLEKPTLAEDGAEGSIPIMFLIADQENLDMFKTALLMGVPHNYPYPDDIDFYMGEQMIMHNVVGVWADKDALSALLDNGGDIQQKAPDGQQPIHAASPRLVQHLLDLGADINAKDKQGNTAAHWACNIAVEYKIQALHKAGADMKAVNNNNQTPLDTFLSQGMINYSQNIPRVEKFLNVLLFAPNGRTIYTAAELKSRLATLQNNTNAPQATKAAGIALIQKAMGQ